MALHEDVIFSDPVLTRVFFDTRRFAPAWGNEVEVVTLQSRITERKVAFFRARSIEALERLQFGQVVRVRVRPTVMDDDQDEDQEPVQIYRTIRIPGFREMYFALRELCDGYYLDALQRLVAGQHVLMFEHDKHDEIFRPQYAARFHLWKKYAQCRPANQPGCRWF